MRLWFSAISYDATGEATDHGDVGSAGVEWENRLDALDEAVAVVLAALPQASTIRLSVHIGA